VCQARKNIKIWWWAEKRPPSCRKGVDFSLAPVLKLIESSHHDEPVKSQNPEGFEKSSSYGAPIPAA
jgi:hypothetical protein